jgi:endoglucanase
MSDEVRAPTLRTLLRHPERRDREALSFAALRMTVFLFAFATESAAQNPFSGKRLYVDPNSTAKKQAETLRRSRPQDAELLAQIADKPVARWLGDWVNDIGREVDFAVSSITRTGALPVFVAYNIPGRDCGLYSAGGARGGDAYRKWIRSFADGVKGRHAIVILEPDALPSMDCLTPSAQADRLVLLRDAVETLKSRKITVYVDAGSANWRSPEIMAQRLRAVNIEIADGFTLNVSNYQANEKSIAYGEKLSKLLNGKHFLIDTSRNGLGTNEWCNARGQALGVAPTTNTGHPLVDAFLWVKQPGESDGTCQGGPRAGTWWTEIALELSRAASNLARTIAK